MTRSRYAHHHAGVLLVSSSLLALCASAQQLPDVIDPMINPDSVTQVSEHVYVIPDDDVVFVPNVGIVVGDRATLIIDTGLGPRNGEIVLEAARKLSKSESFYLAATHFHPEHDLGATAFPPDAKMVRWRMQQDEADSAGKAAIDRFSGFAPVLAELLADAEFRAPDILFDDSMTLDLGGVRVEVMGVGPNHTRGDTVYWVEADGVLFTGDVVMSVFPAVSAQSADIDKWIENMNAFEAMNPSVVVPAHRRMGDIEFIRRYRDYLQAVQAAVGQFKQAGGSADEAGGELAGALAERFSELTQSGASPTGRINAAIQAAYRSLD